MKWLVGIFVPIVGRWGLDSLLERSQIDEYLESDLRCRCLMTDEDGALVHPDTGRRTVRICSRYEQLKVINLRRSKYFSLFSFGSFVLQKARVYSEPSILPDVSNSCLSDSCQESTSDSGKARSSLSRRIKGSNTVLSMKYNINYFLQTLNKFVIIDASD